MSADTEQPETPEIDPASAESSGTNESPVGESSDSSADNVEIGSPEYQEISDKGNQTGQPADLNRFQDIKVNVSADLGRAEVPIQTLMNIGEGSVIELDRTIDSPVELVAQGVPLACGEVVVVNGCFAIRVTKVYENQKG